MSHTRSTQWWQALDRRTLGKGALAFATLAAMSGCKGEEEVAGESLDLQRRHGWNLGAEDKRLFFRHTGSVDASGSPDWKRYTDPSRLMDAWRPRSRGWEPYMAPTLMQALESGSLRQQIRPIFSPAMERAFKRGEVLRKDLLSQVTKGPETFFIADLPGPEAVAFGAGLAGWADLIPAFDNWPHPAGVVPSHETLAAMIYYASYVQEQKKQVPEPPPGLLLLDSRRLSPYTDDGAQFDNRYLALVPLQDALRERGIRNVLYVVPDRNQKQERDDLNDEFVAYKDHQIQVSVFPLSDMEQVQERVAEQQPDGTTRTVVHNNYYYGGGFGSHLGFLMLYSFLAPSPFAYYRYPYGGGRRVTFNDTRPTRRPPSYTPRPRPTQFSGTRVGGGRGVGRSKPTGFGRTTVRSSGGRITGLGSRTAGSRSGSFGRGGFSTGA
ncbi:hypothetical protein [Candidatus Entotheonella palauensis]|uniref:hypothetical protein n=1 Tax=Candidatus Entotheonella palauensis TaxID=93172 RepID=UPI000B7D226F|nr:hypothetical protein [Candidatus Entotheonella palauensis]